MLSNLSIRGKPKKTLTLQDIGHNGWPSEATEDDETRRLDFLRDEHSGAACSSCNWAEDILLPCEECLGRFCFDKSKATAGKRCITFDFYKEYIGSNQTWICPSCSRKTRKVFSPGMLDPIQDIRGLFSNTVSPLLIISITAKGVGVVGTEAMIDCWARSHWMNHKAHYTMVHLEGSGDVNKLKKQASKNSGKILDFLQGGNIYRTRVLIVLNTHSDEENGDVTLEANDEGFIVAPIEKALLNILGADVYKVLRGLKTVKGMVAITCGYAFAREESRKRYESLITKGVISFVLGFSTKRAIERHVQDGIVEFVKGAFVEVTSECQRREFDKELGAIAPGHLSFARCVGFSRSPSVHSHTGVILLQQTDRGVQASEFRRGLPQDLPYGLPRPTCGFCLSPNNLSFWNKKAAHTFSFKCTCGARSSGLIRKPDDIHEVSPKLFGPNHFVFSYPYATHKIKITWVMDGCEKISDWSGVV